MAKFNEVLLRLVACICCLFLSVSSGGHFRLYFFIVCYLFISSNVKRFKMGFVYIVPSFNFDTVKPYFFKYNLSYKGRTEFEFGTHILRIRLWFG